MESGESRTPYAMSRALYPVWASFAAMALGVVAIVAGFFEVAMPLFRAAGALQLLVPLFCGFLWCDPRTSRQERLAAKGLAVAVPVLYIAVILVQGKPAWKTDGSFVWLCAAAAALFVVGHAVGWYWRGRALNRE